MSKEKQIDEIFMIIADVACGDIAEDECDAKDTCAHCRAERLYNAGYRKQSEGEWLTEGDMFKEYICSVCGYSVDSHYQKTPFCPNCGAKMKGV